MTTQISSSAWFSPFRIARIEAQFFLRNARLLAAAAVVVLIPALYVWIYLASVWDPAAHTGALPVALVNLDRGLVYRQQPFNVGRDLIARLKVKPTFGYVDYADEASARRDVRQGALAFALIVPADFSSNAVPGAQDGAGKLVIFTSEGNSYPTAGLARRFAEELGREVNQSLNEQRWALVLADAAGSQRSIERLHAGLTQLRLGATELTAGARQAAKGAQALETGASSLDQGVTQFGAGSKALAAGLRSMVAQRAHNADLRRLEAGAQSLLAGHDELGRGIGELHQGARQMQAGIGDFRAQANGSLFGASAVLEGLDQLGTGVDALESGLRGAATAQRKLSEGVAQLGTGIGSLTGGVRSLNTGLRSMVAQLPDDARLDELVSGADRLASGTQSLRTGTQKMAMAAEQLAGGLTLLDEVLPVSVRQLDGNAQGLANSVQPTMEVVAPVQNNGSGFAPNIVPGVLWLGVSLVAFLFQLRALPRCAEAASPVARMLGKIVLPLGLVALQAALVWLCLIFVLKIRVVDSAALLLTLLTAAGAFLLIVFALIRMLGDGGKVLALILLAVQLSSSGGILPVELSGGLFAQLSPYLPITWVVRSLKASLFGAFEGDGWHSLQWVVLAGLLAALLATFAGRWRFVKTSALRPALDL